MTPCPKTPVIRNDKWKRFISTLPCMLCGIEEATQGAHIHLVGQKSKGKKVNDDQIIPLCHEGANGCHKAVDNYEIKIDQQKTVNKARSAYKFWKAGKMNDARYILRCD